MTEKNNPKKEFSYIQLRFVMKASADCILPKWRGSMLRGGFGTALKQLVCKTEHQSPCEPCQHISSCLYATLFESQSKSVGRDEHQNLPHPIVIKTPLASKTEVPAGEDITFDLLLTGRAQQDVLALINAFYLAGQSGWGNQQAPFLLYSVHQEVLKEHHPVWTPEDGMQKQPVSSIVELPSTYNNHPNEKTKKQVRDITLTFETPLVLMERKKLLKLPEFSSLMKAIFRRTDLLMKAHLDQPLDLDYQQWLKAAETVSAVEWSGRRYNLKRYSNRQNRPVMINGALPIITYSGEALHQFMPFLELGSHIHIGKGTVMGLGKYRIKKSG